MENNNVLNDKELQQVNGGMVAFLEEVSGSSCGVGYRKPEEYDCSGIVSMLQGNFIGNYPSGKDQDQTCNYFPGLPAVNVNEYLSQVGTNI
jgi:hypothetical protein